MASLGKSTLRRMLGLTATVLVVVGSPAVSGPTVTIRRLESLLVQSGLAGTVRCVTAGEDAATFEVLESWKGPPAGSRVTIRRCPSFWKYTWPFGEPGVEFVVLAHGDAPTEGEPAFVTIKGQGLARLPLVPHSPLKMMFGHPGRGFATLRRAALEFLARPEPEQELESLRRTLHESGRCWASEFPSTSYGYDQELCAALESATTVDACVTAWLDSHRRGTREANLTCLAIAGGRRTLALLERIDVATKGIDEVQLGMALTELRRTFPGEPPARKDER